MVDSQVETIAYAALLLATSSSPFYLISSLELSDIEVHEP